MAATPPMILVAGAAGVGKAALLRALGANPAAAAGSQNCLHTLHLDTKYYTADLLVHCHEVSTSSSPGTAAALDRAAVDQLQALVLVVDAGSSRSHAAAMDFFQSLQDREFDIQLLVANKVDSLVGQQDNSSGAGPRPAWLQDARTWCYSNGFEYIEAAAGTPAADATLQDEDGEQQGVARVLAALQAHMWPNMQQKPPSQPSAAAAAASTSSTGSSSAKDQGGERLPQPPLEQAAHLAQAASTAAVDAVPTQQHSGPAAKRQPAQQQQQQAKQQQGPAVLDLDENPFLDADVDGFEQLMRQVMGECDFVWRARTHHMQGLPVRGAGGDISTQQLKTHSRNFACMVAHIACPRKPHMVCCRFCARKCSTAARQRQ